MGESTLGFPSASPAAAAAVLSASAVPPLVPSTSRLVLPSVFVSMTLGTAAGGVTEANGGPGRPSFFTFLVISIFVLSSDANSAKERAFSSLFLLVLGGLIAGTSALQMSRESR